MSGYNLPDGVSVFDIPGNRPIDVFVDRYVEDHWNLDRFNQWLSKETGTSVEVSEEVMLWVLESCAMDNDFREYLESVAEEEWSSR
jgi:hypothetical protein